MRNEHSKNIYLNSKSSNFYDENNPIFSFSYDAISLEGKMKEDFEFEYHYYMSLKVSDLLYDLRKEAGLDTLDGKSPANEKGSWFYLGGNVLGQFLQAYARFYASTKREEVLKKARELVKGFKEISDISPNLFDGFVMYFFEKYLRGFTDCYVLCGIEDALLIAKRLIDEAIVSPIYTKPELILGNNGPGNEIEWYTIPESIFYFADVYKRKTGEDISKYYELAKRFGYYTYWNIFVNGENFYNYTPLGGQNTAHFHAYSHINTLNSCAYFYHVTKDDYYFDAIKNCYEWMKDNQALPTGAYGCHIEWIMPKTGIINAINNYHDSFETQCNSYAVYRVGNFLLTKTKEAKYADWSERLIFNATLASEHIDDLGHTFYYSDYNTKESKKYLHPNTWTCCTGSRPLLMNELRRSIYFYDENTLYIAQFIPSTISCDGAHIKMDVSFNEKMNIDINVSNNSNLKQIRIRKPEWLDEDFEISDSYVLDDGWIVIDLKDEKKISVKYPLTLKTEVIKAKGEGVSCLRCGPFILASDARNDVSFNPLEDTKKLKYISPLHYSLDGGEITFKPFMDYKLDEPYHMFFNLRNYLKKEGMER